MHKSGNPIKKIAFHTVVPFFCGMSNTSSSNLRPIGISLVGFAVGFYIGGWLLEDQSMLQRICVIKNPASLYPIHPDEQIILTEHLGLRAFDSYDAVPEWRKKSHRFIYYPTDWQFADAEVKALQLREPQAFRRSMILPCLIDHDQLACKAALILNVKNLLGKDAMKYLPRSWSLQEWQSEQSTDNKFDLMCIAKTNLQRQCATMLFHASEAPSLEEMHKHGIVVVQALESRPLCIKELKTTLRVYVLMFKSHGAIHIWRYSDGFVYYTPLSYVEDSDDIKRQVASGYIDRAVYDTRPLTMHDLWRSMSVNEAQSYARQIDLCLQSTLGALLRHTQLLKGTPSGAFQLFGCDILLKDNSTEPAVLLEVNKLPDLGYKSERDGQLKRAMLKQMWHILSSPHLLGLQYHQNAEHMADNDNRMWLNL